MDSISELMDELGQRYNNLSPQLRLAARYVMDNPQDVSISSVRALSDAASVKPNSLKPCAMVQLIFQIASDGFRKFVKKAICPSFMPLWFQTVFAI